MKVIKRLYERNKDVRRAVMAEARSVLETVDRDETAEEVFLLLDSIEVKNL